MGARAETKVKSMSQIDPSNPSPHASLDTGTDISRNKLKQSKISFLKPALKLLLSKNHPFLNNLLNFAEIINSEVAANIDSTNIQKSGVLKSDAELKDALKNIHKNLSELIEILSSKYSRKSIFDILKNKSTLSSIFSDLRKDFSIILSNMKSNPSSILDQNIFSSQLIISLLLMHREDYSKETLVYRMLKNLSPEEIHLIVKLASPPIPRKEKKSKDISSEDASKLFYKYLDILSVDKTSPDAQEALKAAPKINIDDMIKKRGYARYLINDPNLLMITDVIKQITGVSYLTSWFSPNTYEATPESTPEEFQTVQYSVATKAAFLSTSGESYFFCMIDDALTDIHDKIYGLINSKEFLHDTSPATAELRKIDTHIVNILKIFKYLDSYSTSYLNIYGVYNYVDTFYYEIMAMASSFNKIKKQINISNEADRKILNLVFRLTGLFLTPNSSGEYSLGSLLSCMTDLEEKVVSCEILKIMDRKKMIFVESEIEDDIKSISRYLDIAKNPEFQKKSTAPESIATSQQKIPVPSESTQTNRPFAESFTDNIVNSSFFYRILKALRLDKVFEYLRTHISRFARREVTEEASSLKKPLIDRNQRSSTDDLRDSPGQTPQASDSKSPTTKRK